MKQSDAFKALNQKLIEQLKQAIDSANPSDWKKPWTFSSVLPTNLMTEAQYQGGNVFYLMLSQMLEGYSSPYWMTFKQKCDLEKKYEQPFVFRKGQHGTACVRWVTWIPKRFKKSGDKYIDTKAGEIKTKDQATQIAPKKFVVFNLDQFEEIPEELIDTDEPIIEYEQAWQFFIESGADYRQAASDRACYLPNKDSIHIPLTKQFLSEGSLFATLFHELVHWTGHASRCKRDMSGSFGSADYAFEELVAEIGSLILCAQFGINGQFQHAEYLAHWLTKLEDDERFFWKASKLAQEAVDFLNNQAQQQEAIA